MYQVLSKMFLLTLTVISIGCAPAFEVAPIQEPGILKYAKVVSNEAEDRGVYLDFSEIGMEFSVLMSNTTLGYCREITVSYLAGYDVRKYNKIFINETLWSISTDTEKEQLLAHELGHCVLGRDHDDDIIEREGELIHKSVMSTYSFSDNVFKRHREYYFDELFK